ncbi:MAG: aminodeoxychorismate lyase [Flavobacterium sp. BFFFF2]|nr:MAG: aminodeoxychorismate lyase [Flavobacterium sp. BFFFF2]
MTKKKLALYVVLGALTILIGICISIYITAFTANTKFDQDEIYIYIPTGSNYDQVKELVGPFVADWDKFNAVAERRNYTEHVRPGKFLFKKGMSSFQLVASLRHNVPVRLSFNNQERLEDLCVRLSAQMEPDTTQFLTVFRDSIFLKDNGFTKENVFSMLLPNTYEVYWNTTAEKFRSTMLDEYKKFWNPTRRSQCEKLGMSPIDVTILASIVHKETVKKSERPIVAGVYLNRLRTEMPLQADPTVIYALKKQTNHFDQIIKRVLLKDLYTASLYNTYLHAGLPPGPIAMPDVDAIDAVLSPAEHDYLYFCASVTRFGYHEFASDMTQHEANRKKYVTWLNAQGTLR